MLLDYFSRPSLAPDHTQASPSTFEYGASLVHSGLKLAVTPFELAAAAPTQAGTWLGDITTSRDSLQQNNEQLSTENLLLSAKIQRLEAIENENQTLRELLNTSQNNSHQVLIAEIVAIARDPFRQKIQINKGQRESIYVGQPLIDAKGVIGQITRVDPLSSWAILISDADHAIPVEVTRNGLRTIAQGTGDTSKLLLPYLPVDADIRPSDELRTSGLGGVFPAGYPVGTVRSVGRDISGKFAEVYATPSAALDRQRQLLLLLPEKHTATMQPSAQWPKARKQTDAVLPTVDDNLTDTESTAPSSESGTEAMTEPAAEPAR